MIPESHGVVVGDSEDLNLVGVRDVSVVQGTGVRCVCLCSVV